MSSKPKPAPAAPQQQQSYDLSSQLQNQKTAGLGTASNTLGTEQKALSSYLPGSNGMSQFRTNLTNNALSANTSGTNNAISDARMRAQAAGFGTGGQPLTYGAETALQNAGAARAAQIPGQVEQQTAPLELQAAGMYGGTAPGQTSIANSYNPEYYYGQGSQFANENYQNYLDQITQAQRNKAGIWGGIAGIGGNLLGKVI